VNSGKSSRIALGFVALGLVLPGRALAAEGDSPKAAVDRARYQRTVDQLLKDLDDLADKNEDNGNKTDRKYVRERIEAMRQDLAAMRKDLDAAPPAGVTVTVVENAPPTPVETAAQVVVVQTPASAPTPAPTPAGPAALSPPELQAIADAITKAQYSGDKIRILRDAAANDWFTVEQVVTLMGLYGYSNDKVTAAAMLYPRVVDKNDWFKVYAALTYSSDRARLQSMTTGKTP
jgi:hypothetical protein